MPLYCNIDSAKTRNYYGTKLESYLNNKNDDYFFVISSDMSHWGKKYSNNFLEEGFETANEQVKKNF